MADRRQGHGNDDLELLFVSPSPTASTASTSSVVLHGQTKVAEWRGGQAGRHGVAWLESGRRRGGAIWAVKGDRAGCTVWSMQKEVPLLQHHLAAPLSVISASPDGVYLVGAGANRLTLWEIATGLVLRTWEGHYRGVNVLRWTSDSKTFLSGGDDGVVHVWMVADVSDMTTASVRPWTTFSDHTLPVQDVFIGHGTFRTARVFTCALDRTVKVRQMSPPRLLATLLFPAELGDLMVEPLERVLFVSAAKAAADGEVGTVFKTRLYRDNQPVPSFAGSVQHGLGQDGGGGGGPSQDGRLQLPASAGGVTALALSRDANRLYVGSARGQVCLFDVATNLLLATLTPFSGGTPTTAPTTTTGVSTLHLFSQPRDWMVQGVNRPTGTSEAVRKAGTMADSRFEALPLLPMSALRRTYDREALKTVQVPVIGSRRETPSVM